MEIVVFLAVVAAAMLHAGWNSVLKLGMDRATAVLLLTLVQAGIALPMLPFAAQPDAAAWGWIAASALLHCGYMIFLSQAYAHADLSLAYPLARGTAPLLVAGVSVAFLGAVFSDTQLIAILAISTGILVMALRGDRNGRAGGMALFYALGTSVFIASYTLVDGMGVRAAGASSGYILWLTLFEGVGMVIWTVLRRALRKSRDPVPSILSAMRREWRKSVIAGAMSLAAYWITVWAFLHAPIALVAALRESSIFFAVLIAAFALHEPVHRMRWISAAAIVVGVGLIRL